MEQAIINELKSVIEDLTYDCSSETVADLAGVPHIPTSEQIIQDTPQVLRDYINNNWKYFKYCRTVCVRTVIFVIPAFPPSASINYSREIKNKIANQVNGYRGLDIEPGSGDELIIRLH